MTGPLVAGLLILAALTNLGPELVATLTGGSIRAWEYVAEGVQAAALWLVVLVLLVLTARHPLVRSVAAAVCSYGAAEAALRPACRLAFPMDRPPNVPAPEGLCAAAGWPWWWELSPVALALCALAFTPLCRKATPP